MVSPLFSLSLSLSRLDSRRLSFARLRSRKSCRKWITIMWTLLLRVQIHWEICSQNKENRKKQKMSHTVGQQSFAQVHDKKLQESGEESLKVDFFRITHVKKNLEPIDEESSKKLKEMEDKLAVTPVELQKNKETHESIWTESFGEESHGRLRLVGVGVSLKDLELSKSNATLTRKNKELQNKVEMEKMELVNGKLEDEKKKNEDLISSIQSKIEKLTQLFMNRSSLDSVKLG